MIADTAMEELKRLGNRELAAHHHRYFQCFEGGYGDINDEFCGARAPDLRRLVKKYRTSATYEDIEALISHRLHEARLFAACALAEKYARGDAVGRKRIVDFYLKHTPFLNNWDLVDIAAYKILGRWCREKEDYSILRRLSGSKNLWEQRIGMVATWWPTHEGDFAPALELAERFLGHKHDLMHKAAGWMLREVGKRGEAGRRALLEFLDRHHRIMPRTMLRYSIERLEPALRKRYMGK
ncbi:MAG: DNA alkylation repair protein [Rickettsiales bacterium]|jgi:3-methyladenine DNA glycosylase AlkD|nr:DNA alkylation repair protein [Rickettsiales bacterium]